MVAKKLFLFLLFLFANISFSQQKGNPNIIKKDIKINSGNEIYDALPTNSPIRKETDNHYNLPSLKKISGSSKIYVYYNGKFFSHDTLSKIKNINDYTVEIIKIPDSIAKDIQGIIYLKKAAK